MSQAAAPQSPIRNPKAQAWLYAVLACLSPVLVRAALAADEARPLTTCELTTTATEGVASVTDAETIVLDSGRVVRLIGALSPRAFDTAQPSEPWPVEAEAKRRLEALVLGRAVQIAARTPRKDRYGHDLAHVFVTSEGETLWVQGELLKMGLARAYGLPGSFDCARELLAHEDLARLQKLGVWALGTYQVKSAADAARLLAARSRYELVTGKVTAVARTRSAVYLNFGVDFKSDFTARVGRNVLSAFPELAANLDGLKGKDIMVRGWIERRNGPMIDVVDPSQIEIAGNVAATGAPLQPNVSAHDPALNPAHGPLPEKSPGSQGVRPPGVDL